MDLNKFNTAMSNGDDVSSFQIASNIFVKQMVLNQPGNKIFGHSHAYSHVTLIATGSVWMRANGIEERHDAPKLVITPRLFGMSLNVLSQLFFVVFTQFVKAKPNMILRILR